MPRSLLIICAFSCFAMHVDKMDLFELSYIYNCPITLITLKKLVSCAHATHLNFTSFAL
jgi:hypothetical protein